MILEHVLQWLIVALWLVWLLYWLISGLYAKPTRWREPLWLTALDRVPIVIVVLLLVAPKSWPPPLRARCFPEGITCLIIGVLLTAAGLGFSVWARRHLGRNWSAYVTVKQGHTLIRTGPYRIVRHQIYAGILLAFLGLVALEGEWRAVIALAIAAVAFVWKSRREEKRMRATFPEYEEYRRQTAALVPLVY